MTIFQNSIGEESHLAMETSGHGALKENHWLDDGAYLMVRSKDPVLHSLNFVNHVKAELGKMDNHINISCMMKVIFCIIGSRSLN